MTKEQYLSTTKYIAKLLLYLQDSSDLPELPEDVTLRDVYMVSSRHSLAAAAYIALRERIEKSDVPDEYKLKWSREAELATVQHIRHTAAFAELTNAFTAAKIPFLPIKGFIFKALWTRPELRTMADVDIVVSEETFASACDVLTSIGYVLDHDGEVHYSYTKNKFINVELHRMLYSDAVETFDDWKPKQENPFWYEMSYEDFFVFVLRHAYKHYESGGCGLRTVFDFYLLMSKNGRADNSPLLIEKIKKAELYPFYITVTKIIDSWFYGVCSDNSYESELFIATGGVYGTLDNNVSYSINKHGGKASHVFHRIFPPAKTIFSRYKWVKKCPILLPIGYVVRAFSAVFDRKSYLELQSVAKTDNER